VIELLIGFGVASWMGAGGTYVFLLFFAFLFPRLFRVFYWLLMLPVMTLGPAMLGWLVGGFFHGWTQDAAVVWLLGSSVFGFWFCYSTDPKQT